MDTEVTIDIYEIDGEEVNDKTLVVKSPWNGKQSKVILKIGKKEYTVAVGELEKAIANCANTK